MRAALAREWDGSARRFALPAGVSLCMAEVEDSGSNTVSMVRRVLDWRRADASAAAAERVWQQLIVDNARVATALGELAALAARDAAAYDAQRRVAEQQTHAQWTASGGDAGEHCDSVASIAARLHAAFADVRRGLLAMGRGADTPIEPPIQTHLADATMALPGVLAAGVPGAGGFDAVFALVLGSDARARVVSLWNEWKEMSVCALPLDEDADGLRVEARMPIVASAADQQQANDEDADGLRVEARVPIVASAAEQQQAK